MVKSFWGGFMSSLRQAVKATRLDIRPRGINRRNNREIRNEVKTGRSKASERKDHRILQLRFLIFFPPLPLVGPLGPVLLLPPPDFDGPLVLKRLL